MLSARDIREFRGFLRNATDRQVQGIYDKEKRAGRDDYAELAVAEAERRGIELDEGSSHYHSTKARYEVIESKSWKRDDGRTASLYGAVPWTSPSEEKRWKVVTRGYTVRDNEQGTVGIGRQPWPTRAEAQAWVDKENKRRADLAAARSRSAHATKKTSPEPCVDVVFRVFPEGDVIALFPGASVGGGQINSYQRLGQHGGAAPSLITQLRKATRAEYAPLLTELKQIGYCLRVRA